jgi:transcriptional regulator with XRE-family HTH domain
MPVLTHHRDRQEDTMSQQVIDATDFGTCIRRARKEQGLTQQQLADFFSSFSREFLSDRENGKPTVELGRALKVAGALGLRFVLAEDGGIKRDETA